jgi:hypothetical protein
VDDIPATTAERRFYESVKRDADAYLAGNMTPAEFAGSVWHEAGTTALELGRGGSQWLEHWIKFAHWEDEIDEANIKDGPEPNLRRVEEQLRDEARSLLGVPL